MEHTPTPANSLSQANTVLPAASSSAAHAAGASTPTLAQRHVLVLGLGASGLAMARWCARSGAQLTVADSRQEPPQLAALQHDVPQVRFVAGSFAPELLAPDVCAVFVSPGLSPADTHSVLDAARQKGLWVGGELDLFVHALGQLQQERGYTPKVLGITGTNGKTTVTALTGQLLARAGQTVAVAGNIGPTLLGTLTQALQADALPQSWVLELSSFQLNNCTVFEPTAATCLNITQDHLDWHGSIENYTAAKANIFGKYGTAILNRDDPAVMALLAQLQPASEAANLPKSASPAKAAKATKGSKAPAVRAWSSFGAGLPERAGDFGLEHVNGMTWLVRAAATDDAAPAKSNRAAAGDKSSSEDIYIQRLMPADALRIRGRHNACNALAALALAEQAGAALAPMLYGLREYRGEPHRVEPVGSIAGVEYFDDSKGTNVGATLAALQGLGAQHKLVAILGGEGKGQDFAPLAAAVRSSCRAVVLIGRDAPLLAQSLQESGVPLIHASSMQEAVQAASAQAQAGDAVLLSPACASFDMFKDYIHRAEAFRQAVQTLAQEQGVMLEGAQ